MPHARIRYADCEKCIFKHILDNRRRTSARNRTRLRLGSRDRPARIDQRLLEDRRFDRQERAATAFLDWLSRL